MIPEIALNNRIFDSTETLIEYAKKNGYTAIDYSFPYGLQSVAELHSHPPNLEKIRLEDIRLRFHCPFRSAEIASPNSKKAAASVELLKWCVDMCAIFNGETMTVHIGMGIKSGDHLNYDNAVAGLSELASYGERRNVAVCLENLTKGRTSRPETWLELIEKSGVGATFDLGHANASPCVLEGRTTSLEFLKAVAPHIRNAHVYEIEKIGENGIPYHVAPENLNVIGPLLSELLNTDCDYWLIELINVGEVEHTRNLLRPFLS